MLLLTVSASSSFKLFISHIKEKRKQIIDIKQLMILHYDELMNHGHSVFYSSIQAMNAEPTSDHLDTQKWTTLVGYPLY